MSARHWRLAAIAGLLVLAGVVAGVVAAMPTGAADPVEAAASRFLDRYMDDDGRVVRRDQGGDTVSEGQAYAMLIAVGVGDRVAFDRAWGWARANLQRPDGLLSWHWADGRVRDPQPATDADLDAARALVLAADRFGVEAYRDEAVVIARGVMSRETIPTDAGRMLVAGPWATTGTAWINPSYFSPPAYETLREATGDVRWRGVAETSDAVLEALLAGDTGLAPDWAVVDRPGGAVQPDAFEGEPVWGLDAARVSVRYAEGCEPGQSALAAKAWPFLGAEADGDGVLARYGLGGEPLSDVRHPLGLVAAAGAAAAAGETGIRDDLLDRAEALDRGAPTYYGAAWVALGRLSLTTDSIGGCPPADADTAPRDP